MQSEAAKYLESNGVLLDTREVISRIEGVLFPPVSVSILDMAQYSKPVVDSHLQCLNKGLAAIESDSKICFLCFFFFFVSKDRLETESLDKRRECIRVGRIR